MKSALSVISLISCRDHPVGIEIPIIMRTPIEMLTTSTAFTISFYNVLLHCHSRRF